MAYSAPAFENKLLLPSEQCISGESCDSILSLLDFCKVLPRPNCNSESVVVYFLFEESVETALLLSFLVLQFFYG